MPDEASRSVGSSRGSAGFTVVVVVFLVLVLPALYVLSIGPAEYLLMRGYIDGEVLRPIYWPLAWLYQSFEPIRPIFDWYLEWWH